MFDLDDPTQYINYQYSIIGEVYGLIATRILIGFLQGPLHPCLSSFAVAWFPLEQRGRFCSIVFTGVQVKIKNN